jgi:hypothetical protein
MLAFLKSLRARRMHLPWQFGLHAGYNTAHHSLSVDFLFWSWVIYRAGNWIWDEEEETPSQRYAGQHGLVCPYCGSLELGTAARHEFRDEHPGRVFIHTFCDSCKRSWYDHYLLLGFTPPEELDGSQDDHQ